ncbi:MAG: hypothetical protein NC201_03440 [Prevotella sp.]|nr:hypothetical protein [Bacteroides sp.]MCM1366281.1 hypothetical protein [Prevotella sp.]MCM1436315.1 hypothetical protein [Prevotella sp.]
MRNLFFISLISILLFGCEEKVEVKPFVHQECNSIYYWRTDFRLDSIERDFLTTNQIGRMYIRFFDIVAEDNYFVSRKKAQYDFLPNATLTFTDTIPGTVKHVVPTIYITIDALKAMKGKETDAASKIVHRTLNMVSYNDIPNVSELQLDCDWTESTDSTYFALCKAVRDTLNSIAEVPFTLSSTIRLHQLKKAAPPVDYGVLMCYNTGSFRNLKSHNSILNFNDVAPYLKSTVNYPLHLDLALPIYDWTLCYRNNEFAGIISTDSIFHTSFTKSIKEDFALYRATSNAQMGQSSMREGDVLRHEKSDFNVICRVKDLIYSQFSNKPKSIILYHLDSKNIKNFSDNEISQIYNRSDI